MAVESDQVSRGSNASGCVIEASNATSWARGHGSYRLALFCKAIGTLSAHSSAPVPVAKGSSSLGSRQFTLMCCTNLFTDLLSFAVHGSRMRLSANASGQRAYSPDAPDQWNGHRVCSTSLEVASYTNVLKLSVLLDLPLSSTGIGHPSCSLLLRPVLCLSDRSTSKLAPAATSSGFWRRSCGTRARFSRSECHGRSLGRACREGDSPGSPQQKVHGAAAVDAICRWNACAAHARAVRLAVCARST
jgi:hypothetical protein